MREGEGDVGGREVGGREGEGGVGGRGWEGEGDQGPGGVGGENKKVVKGKCAYV